MANRLQKIIKKKTKKYSQYYKNPRENTPKTKIHNKINTTSPQKKQKMHPRMQNYIQNAQTLEYKTKTKTERKNPNTQPKHKKTHHYPHKKPHIIKTNPIQIKKVNRKKHNNKPKNKTIITFTPYDKKHVTINNNTRTYLDPETTSLPKHLHEYLIKHKLYKQKNTTQIPTKQKQLSNSLKSRPHNTHIENPLTYQKNSYDKKQQSTSNYPLLETQKTLAPTPIKTINMTSTKKPPTKKFTLKNTRKTNFKPTYIYHNKKILLKCGDIESNPGPRNTLLSNHPPIHMKKQKTYFYNKTTQIKPEYRHILEAFLPYLYYTQTININPHLLQFCRNYQQCPKHYTFYAILITLAPTPAQCNQLIVENSIQ